MDRLDGQRCRQVSEPFNDVFREEHPLVFFFAPDRVVVDRADDPDVCRMHGCSV